MANKKLTELGTLAATLSTWIPASNASGILGKIAIDTIKALIDVAANITLSTAIPSTNPGAATGNRMWVASTPGTYTNFAGIVIGAAEVAFIVDTGSTFVKVTIPIDLANYLQASQIVDNLTSTSTVLPLSANQGRLLKLGQDTKAATDKVVPVSTGKNMVNPLDSNYLLNKNFTSGGVIQDAASPWRVTGYIPVLPNTTYYPSYKNVLVYYDILKNQISVESSGRANQYVTTPATAAYIRFAAAATNVQLELGNAGTTFEAFKYTIDKKDSQDVNALHLDSTLWTIINGSISSSISAVTDPMKAEINILAEQIDEALEPTEPLYISMFNFAAGTAGPTGASLVIAVSGAAGSKTMTASATDITNWGVGANPFPIHVRHATGEYHWYLCISATGTTITIDKPLIANAVDLMCGYESPTGQHLTRWGYRSLGDYTFNAFKREAYKNRILYMANMLIAKQISGQGIKLFSTVDDSLMADLTLIGGATTGGFSPGGIIQIAQPTNVTINYNKMNALHFALQQGGAAGKGIQWPVTLDKKTGYVEVWIATDVDKGNGVLSLELDGVQTFSQVVNGALQRIIIPFSNAITGVLKVTTETTADAAIRIGDVIWWQKRNVTGKIFSPTDKVVFLGDSWTQFPATLLPGEVKPLRPDGTVSDGMCFWPERFKELFVAAGGVAGNVLDVGKGGMTSAWGLYWFDTIVKAYNPTHVVIEFFTNDNSSKDNVAGHLDSVYDFDPVQPYVLKVASAGGVFGSVTWAQWKANIKAICDKAIAAGIKPVVIMPAWVGPAAQCNSHSSMNEMIIQGL